MTKGQIIHVGTIDPVSHGPRGWVFNGFGRIPALAIQPDGTYLYTGYTVQELKQIQHSLGAPGPEQPYAGGE